MWLNDRQLYPAVVVSEQNTGRIELVRRAAERWRKDLVDTSGRNRLRRFRDLKTSTLDLTPGRAESLDHLALDRLLGGKSVGLHNLFPERADDPEATTAFGDARRRVFAIHKRAITDAEEKGIDSCFAALGLATWKADQGAPPIAPVVLVPLEIEASGAAARDFQLRVSGDAHLNPVLTHILRTEHDIDAEELEAEVAEDPPTALARLQEWLDGLLESWYDLPDLEIEPRVVISNFSYSTMPLVADLEQNEEQIASHDVVAAIAGDVQARVSLAGQICDPDFNQPDRDHPADEFLILDADSSQHRAINRVLGGESLVIQGPPGTGKSQTIANLVTALVARGKRVLFVAEKRAAIEAVTKRLERVGLDDLVMDMHGGVTSRREFARTLADSLNLVSRIPEPDYSATQRRLELRREELIRNDTAVHQTREPWMLSVFEMRERILAIPEAARTLFRLTRQSADGLSPQGFDQLTAELEEWMDLEGHVIKQRHPEWAASTIETKEDALVATDMIRDLYSNGYPDARDLVGAALDEVGLAFPTEICEWSPALDLLEGIEAGLTSWQPELFQLDLDATQQALQPANRGTLSRLFARLFNAEYRSAIGRVRSVLRDPDSHAEAELPALIVDAIAQLADWRSRSVDAGLPRTSTALVEVRTALTALLSSVRELGKLLSRDDLEEIGHQDLAELLQLLVDTLEVAGNLPRLREIEASFDERGIASIAKRVGDEIAPELAVATVEHAWLSKILEDLNIQDHTLRAFDADRHAQKREEFVDADREHLESTPIRVKRLVAESIVETMEQYAEERDVVRREAAKRRRHLSVRQLFAQAPHMLSALRPCWTMSPILVAEMIPLDRKLFDVVIFDEASQIPPAESIGCLARASQVVVAGDSRQLPPTSFFGRTAEDDEEDEPEDRSLTRDIESLLDVADALLRDQILLWHYRSRDDRLIAFSNQRIYGGALTAFPGAIVESPIAHELIPFRPISGVKGTRSNPDEVERVVDLVLHHAYNRPGETLGVIAFGQHHANNIEDLLHKRLGETQDSSLDEFFSETNEERFFVKNIERVQGDERDVIILSLGYHKDPNGNLPLRFGPLNQEGGERRLNVAVTRARSRLTLVSSFSHHDIAPGRTEAKGVELLRQYLEFAASGGEELGAETSDVPLNPFELSVLEGLERRGIPVATQYGVSGYRIDFACAHPDEPGRMVLAVEADGASYHSSATARDRDRLRQQVLEDKGWRFHRIWSTEWFRNREAELDRVERVWRAAVAAAARGEAVIASGRRPQENQEQEVDRPVVPQAHRRGQRPLVPRRGAPGYASIADYSAEELVMLARWIESDTLLRTEDGLRRAMMDELGFKRAGSRIERMLTNAIQQARR